MNWAIGRNNEQRTAEEWEMGSGKRKKRERDGERMI